MTRDAGCTAFFTSDSVQIKLNNKLIIAGSRSLESNRLWTLDLTNEPLPSHSANAALSQSANPADLVIFAHASLFSPVFTLKKALQNNFISLPGLTKKTLAQYPPASVAMQKGHLDQARQHQQSTQSRDPPPTPDDILDEILFPAPHPTGERTHHCYAACIETTKNNLPTKPVVSLSPAAPATLNFLSSTTTIPTTSMPNP